jgi:hypothetical protein
LSSYNNLDAFFDDDRMSETLEVLPFLGRCKYPVTSAYLVSLFDPLAASLTVSKGQGNLAMV